MHIVDEKNTKYHAASLCAQKQNCSAWKKKNKDTPAADVEKVLGKSKKKIRTHLLLTLGNVVCYIYIYIALYIYSTIYIYM